MTAAALHIQVAQAGVARARADADLVALLAGEDQIRATLDTDGVPAGISHVVVRCRDLGGHQGLSSRKLVDVELRYTVRTHIDEDPDRSTHDAVCSAVLATAAAAWTPALTAWVVRHVRAPESTDVEADAAGVFRQTDIVQTLLCQAVADPGTPVDPAEPSAPADEVTDPADTDRLTIWVGASLTRAYITWQTLAALLGGGGGSGDGTPGEDGADGWSPVLAVVADGDRRVLQVASWTGGSGTPPASGLYVGATGLVAEIGDAVDVRGPAGAPGSDGADGADAVYSDSPPQDLAAAAAPGTAEEAARADHKHRRPTPAEILAYRAQTPAAAAEVSGAAVAPAFASSLTLQWTLTGSVTSFAAATGLADGETGMILVPLGSYALPAAPPSGAYQGAWTVTGPLVRIIIERIGSTYLWSADSLEVVA